MVGHGHDQESEDSSLTLRSFTSLDLLNQSKPDAKCNHLDDNECAEYKHFISSRKHLSSSKRLTTAFKNSRFRAGRRQSLVQCLKNKITQPQLRTKHRSTKLNCTSTFKHDCTCNDYTSKDSGDLPEDRSQYNQSHFMYPAFIRQGEKGNKEKSSSPNQKFPFENTPSGHYKLKPSQIVYKSKNFSILAADPQKVLLNVTDSTRTIENETNKMPGNVETWETTCHFSTLNEKRGIPIGSEFSDSVAESDGGMRHKDMASDIPSEISLAKMGFVTDNCIDWNKIELPKKSDLNKLIMQSIINKINPDVQIKIGNTGSHFNCHRIVLQCYSSLITSKSGPIIELPADLVPKDVFSLIYQWMLHDDSDMCPILRRDNILKLYNASRYLGIKELESQCLAFIENSEIFFEDKAFLLYVEARKCGNKDIMELMVPRVQRFFLTLVSSKEFVELSYEEVCTFLNSNYASIHNELEMFMAAVRWLSYQWEARKPVAADVMRCLRFQYINSKCLLLMRRTKQPIEIKRVVNIPEVTKMIDDSIAYQMIKTSEENKPEEEFEKELKKINLTHPIPRNWTGTHKDYQNYREFLKDLSLYRSKHRLEIKQSKIQMHMMDLDDNDFLSQAVLPETTHERINQLKLVRRSYPSHLPKLDPREREELKKVLSGDEREKEGSRRQHKAKLCSMAEHEFIRPVRYSPCRNSKVVRKQRTEADVARMETKEELDIAARKIQKAYRGYALKKRSSGNIQTKAMRISHLKYRSNPNLSCNMVKSPMLPNGKSKLSLHTGVETMFTFGGFNPFDNPQVVDTGRLIYRYNIDINVWVKCGELPSPKHYHGVCSYQGKIYVAGGKDPSQLSNGVTRRVWRYDPDYKTWSRVADMVRPRRSFGLVVCCNRMFAVGGRDNRDRILSSVEKYDPATESWVEVQPMLEPRTGAGVSEFRGAIWAVGGIVKDGIECRASHTVERYDYKTNTWSYCAPLRYNCAFSVLLPMAGRLYLVGGAIGLHGELRGSSRLIDVLDPDNNAWCLFSTLKKCRHAHSAVYLRGVPQSEPSHLFVLGGMISSQNTTTDNVECWQVHEDTCITGIAPLPCPMSGFGAIVLPHRTF